MGRRGNKHRGQDQEPRRQRQSDPGPVVIRRTDALPIAQSEVRVAVLGRGSLRSTPLVADRGARDIGTEVGRQGWVLVTGGGNGLPREAEKRAHAQGAQTWAISAVTSVQQQRAAHGGDIRSTSVLFATRTGGGLGTIEREAPLVQVSNIRTYVNGGPGTFGELIAGLHAPGVVACLEGTGGVGGRAMRSILPYIGVPDDVRVVSDNNPEALLRQAQGALYRLRGEGVDTTPRELFTPPEHRSVIQPYVARSRNVFALLVDDGGQGSPEDRARATRLAELASESRINGKPALPILAQGAEGSVNREVVRRSGTEWEREIHVVTTDAPENARQPTTRLYYEGHPAVIHRHDTGNGGGVGEFASHREVVEHADAVLVTSAHFRNLSGLAFALRNRSKNPIIGVLESESTNSHRLREILQVVTGNENLGDRFIFDSDPESLMRRVEEKMRPSYEYRSWRSGSSSDVEVD